MHPFLTSTVGVLTAAGPAGDGNSPPWALVLMGIFILVVGGYSYLEKK